MSSTHKKSSNQKVVLKSNKESESRMEFSMRSNCNQLIAKDQMVLMDGCIKKADCTCVEEWMVLTVILVIEKEPLQANEQVIFFVIYVGANGEEMERVMEILCAKI